MFEAIRQHPQRKRLNTFDGFLTCLAVSKSARQVHDLGDPTPVLLALYLDGKHFLLPPEAAKGRQAPDLAPARVV